MITCFRNDFAGQRAEKGAGAEANRRSKDVSLGYRRTSYRLPHPICAERYLHIVALRGASRKMHPRRICTHVLQAAALHMGCRFFCFFCVRIP